MEDRLKTKASSSSPGQGRSGTTARSNLFNKGGIRQDKSKLTLYEILFLWVKHHITSLRNFICAALFILKRILCYPILL